MYRITTLIITFAAILAFSPIFSQQIIDIADQEDPPITPSITCTETIKLFGSYGDGGNLVPGETYSFTFCIDASSDAHAQILISPELFGDIWDVDANSSLFVYDGPTTGAALIGVFNSASFPEGVNLQGSGSCLTFEFVFGGTSTGAGFTATLGCYQPYQDFSFTLIGTPPLGMFKDLPYPAMKICYGESITLNVETSYPLSDAGGNGYTQSDNTSMFRYIMGDGTIYEGLGLTEITHTYANPYGYAVNVFVTDVNQFVKSEKFYVLIAPRPMFSNLAVNDTLCINEETNITGGISGPDTLGVAPGTSAILGGGIFGEMMYLPDGNNNLYETVITIDEFEDDQVIESVSDIISMCVNMEHSYLGDLEMGLTCPDGTMIIIFNSYNGSSATQMFPGGFGGGNKYLGDARWGSTNNGIPGVGYDYCFSDDASTGTFAQIFNNPEYLFSPTPISGGTAIKAGTYLPEESFESFLGCPINGDWTLSVKDNWSIDDGFIFNWSIYFDPNINPTTVYYSPDIDSVYWEANVDIIENNGTTITVKPSAYGNNSFTFVVVDEFDCVHDTVVNVYVRPLINLDDDIACDLTQILKPYDELNQSVKDGIFHVVNAPTATASIGFEQLGPATYEATATEYGIYEIMITSEDCGYTDTAFIDFRPDPVIEPFVSDTILCIGANIVLDAGPQEANSGNFNINWISSNSGSFNTEDYVVTIDETGIYSLILSGHCATVMDTIDVVAITLDYDGKTTCGLQSSAKAVISPDGKGKWTGPENISFSSANQLGTQVSSNQYGTYDVTYTDDRCVEDGLTRQFIFVEQPEAIILPKSPDFCVDLDPLVITATVDGSFNGVYRWAVNGEPLVTTNDSLFFEKMYFDPLKNYNFEVVVQDFYSVCPLATGEMNFTGKWCNYNIPNVVTPNGDGFNDTFYVEHVENFPGAHLRVYDRWGLKVFDQPNYDQYQKSGARTGWDPVDMNSGTYFYELLLPSVEKIESGYIQILKKESN